MEILQKHQNLKFKTLTYAREFHYKFNCPFSLQNYPFDTQTCTIQLSKEMKVTNFIKLFPNILTYKGPKQLMEFTVLSYKMESSPTSCMDHDIVITVVLKRRIGKHITSTFLPSLCILILAQVSHINIQHLECPATQYQCFPSCPSVQSF